MSLDCEKNENCINCSETLFCHKSKTIESLIENAHEQQNKIEQIIEFVRIAQKKENELLEQRAIAEKIYQDRKEKFLQGAIGSAGAAIFSFLAYCLIQLGRFFLKEIGR